jgi:hypothetical protein
MIKVFKSVMLAMAVTPVLIAWWSNSVTERRRLNVDRLDVVDTPSVPDQDSAVAGAGIDSNSLDATERQIVRYEKDPMTGSRFFSVDGSPVEGKLKAYLDAAREAGELTIMVNHPEGESEKWVEIPIPLFLSLTDQPPSS